VRYFVNAKFDKLQITGISCYADLVAGVVGATPTGGITVKDMATAVGVMNSMTSQKQESFVTMEDAEWTYTMRRLEVFPFAVVHQELVSFIDAVVKAEETSPDA
jgi:succinyl-CoA synthetase beta subunit